MTFFKKHFLLPMASILATCLFWGCESNFKEVQKINFSEFIPSGDADNVDLKYTDSGYIKVVLRTPKMQEYTNVDFPFTQFPNGIEVTLYDNKAKKTIVRADYAVSFKQTNIIDLQGNVKITSQNGQTLETEQLYFDQKNEWFFTEKKFKFTDPKGVSYGQGIDFSKDFKQVNSQRIKGEVETTE